MMHASDRASQHDQTSGPGRADESRLTAAVEIYLSTLEQGEPLNRAEFVAGYPEFARELARCLEGLELIHRVSPELRQQDATLQTPATDRAAEPATLGDYQILREAGRGGMGVVYEAQQISLPRRVALKVLPFAAVLDRRQLVRFKNEARAAATLDHPGIVSVYNVGCERGVHYYAMQYIEGQTLAELIGQMRQAENISELGPPPLASADGPTCRRRTLASSSHGTGHFLVDRSAGTLGSETPAPETEPAAGMKLETPASGTPAMGSLTTDHSRGQSLHRREHYRQIARLGIQAAEALDHAHGQGVLHRDIKPGNLMLDGDGKLYITDFGLARIETDAGMTMTGDIMGTLRYMAPEQALGKRAILDQRADIYSLGATLYELLCLEPVFDAEDRQSLLEQIARQEPCPPCRINKLIPHDLGTIVLMALQKNPAARYGTALELADDLGRFLNHRPIRARRSGPIDTLGKWARRHRALTWAAVAVLVITTLVSLVSAVLVSGAYQREKKQRLLAEKLQRQADQQAERAEQLAYAADMRLAGLAWKNQDMRQVRALLDRHQPIMGGPDRRGFEWHFLDRASRGNLLQMATMASSLYQVTYSPDGHWVATAGEDGLVRLFEAQTGHLAEVFDSHQGEVNEVRFAPDGNRFVTAGDDGTLKIWQRAPQRLLKTIQAFQKQAFQACFSPDQTLLASCGHDRVIRLWDPRTGDSRGTLSGHTGTVEAVAISPDGALLASASRDQSVRIWDLATRTVRQVLPHGGKRALALAFAPDGKWLLTVGLDQTLHSWDTQTGKPLHLFSAFKQPDDLRSVAISADARWVATGTGTGTVRLWHLPETPLVPLTDSRQHRISWHDVQAHTGRVFGLAFSPDGSRLVSAGQDGHLMLIQPKRAAARFSARPRPAAIVDFKPVAQRQMVVTAGKQGVQLVDLKTGAILHEFAGPDPFWHGVAVSADARRLAASNENGTVSIWDLLSRTRLGHYTLDKGASPNLTFSPHGKTLATLIDRQLVLMDVESGKWRQPDFGQQTAWAAFSPDGANLALAKHETNNLEIWDWRRQTRIQTYPGHGTVIYKLSYGPRGRLLAAVDTDRRLIVWDLQRGIELFAIVTHEDHINNVLFTPDGRSLATYSNDGCLRLWHVATGSPLFDLVALPRDQIMRAALAHNGQYLCYVGEHERLLRIAPGVAAPAREQAASPWTAADRSLNRPSVP